MFDNVGCQSFPAPFPALTVSLEIECEVVEAGKPLSIEVVFIDEDGATFINSTMAKVCPDPVRGAPGRLTVDLELEGGRFAIPKAGMYRFDVLANGVHLGHERLLFF